MLVKITNGNVDTYPYSVGQLRRDNPNTSFSKQIPDDMLESYGILPVTFTDMPSIDDRTQKVEQEATPSLVSGAWTIGWTTSSKTADETAEYDDNMAASNRNTRDNLLSQSDWTQVADAPVDATVWATYRQALRDITSHVNWPNLGEADWPVKP
tara:strand:+ start:49 stop:510 length:462 start_codon:yes stop_codon:yes gene_type:complete